MGIIISKNGKTTSFPGSFISHPQRSEKIPFGDGRWKTLGTRLGTIFLKIFPTRVGRALHFSQKINAVRAFTLPFLIAGFLHRTKYSWSSRYLHEVKVTWIQSPDKVALVRLKQFFLVEINGFISRFVPFALHIFDRLIYIVNNSKPTNNNHFKAFSLVFYSLRN